MLTVATLAGEPLGLVFQVYVDDFIVHLLSVQKENDAMRVGAVPHVIHAQFTAERWQRVG